MCQISLMAVYIIKPPPIKTIILCPLKAKCKISPIPPVKKEIVRSVALGVLLNSFNNVSGLPPVPKPPTAMLAPLRFGTNAGLFGKRPL